MKIASKKKKKRSDFTTENEKRHSKGLTGFVKITKGELISSYPSFTVLLKWRPNQL